MKSFRLISTTATVAVLVGPMAALAETDDSGRLEEVIVTAQKREETFQDLAISVDVITKEDLARSGVTTVQDAIRLVPGVKIQNIAGSGAGRLFIRGIGTTSGDEFTQVISNGVSMNLDGVNSNNASNFLGSMFDVERVEVLKGPQGTLYGASALGGVVNVITARPKQGFEAAMKVQAGNYSATNLQGMLNVPLGEKLAFRVTGTMNERDGYVEGPKQYFIFVPPPLEPVFGVSRNVTADDHGSVDAKNVRARLLFTPTSAFSALISYEKTRDEGTSPTWVNPADVLNGDLVCCNLGPTAPPPFATPEWYENRFYKRKSETWSGEFSYDFGRFGVLTFLPSYNELHDWGRSFELTAEDLANTQPLSQTQETYELRLNSPAESKIVWVGGLYMTTSDRELGAGTATRTPSPDQDGNPATREYGIFEVGRPFDTLNAFAQLTYPLMETLRVTAGARYSENDADYSYQLYRTTNPCSSPPAIACPNSDTVVESTGTMKSDSSHPYTTWTLGVEYDLRPQSLLYGRIATGFKSGGVQLRNTGIPITTTDQLDLGTYENETSIAYEVGSKNRFLGDTLQLNAALFYTKWKNMQLSQMVCVVPGCSPFQDATYVSFYNAGPSTQYGVELDSIWAITSRDRLNLSLSSMKGEYGATAYFWGAPGFQGVVNLDGNEMANTPKLAGNIGYSHVFRIGKGKLTATVEGEYSSDYETTHEYYFAGHTQPSYFRNNVSLTFDYGKVQIVAFGRNLQNETTIQSVFPFGVQASEPRLYGGSIQVSF